jgi:hypothetical protein
MRAPDEAMTVTERKIFEFAHRYLVELAPERAPRLWRLFLSAEVLGLPLHGPAAVRRFLGLSRSRFFCGDPNDDEVVWDKVEITGRMYMAALDAGPRGVADKKEIEELIAKECSRTKLSRNDDLYLRRLAGAFIQNEVPLPSALREWIISNIDKAPPAPLRGARSTIYRDLVIGVTLATIVHQWPIKPTRNPARHGTGTPHSACSIMAAALAALGTHLSEGGVETIWRRHNKMRAVS